ncbi:hypothetical protein PoB_005302400 [Plakobranchus ocellatus]|uniref:Secreted protein n=1 Tax=Plakobranchus ocellatus TaxID=259542 RepID=A0AAV4C763_9GAST|nr:hypothetical protein PoB_005302400 [Plakobranchus ocellatus]
MRLFLFLFGHPSYYSTEGHCHRLLAYCSCSSPNQVLLQRPIINKQKARGTSWAVNKESTVLSYSSDKKTGHARRPILAPSSLSGRIPVT